MAHISLTIDGDTQIENIPLADKAFLLDPNLTGWFQLMYDLLGLEAGKDIEVSALFPDSLELRNLTIAVRPEMENVEVDGIAYDVFVCDIPELGNEIHYVTDNGLLVKIERPGSDTTKDVIIELGVEPVE